ncbi:hypothetical protein Ancab_038352 [Ancistrocladus abbreviatus]
MRGISSMSRNHLPSRGTLSSSISFMPTTSCNIRVQYPIPTLATSANPMCSPPKKRFPSRPLSISFQFSLTSAAPPLYYGKLSCLLVYTAPRKKNDHAFKHLHLIYFILNLRSVSFYEFYSQLSLNLIKKHSNRN